MRQLISLLIIAWLPGAVLLRLPWLDRDRRAALDMAERTFWSVILSVACSLTVVLILAGLERYTFERLLIVNAVLGVAGLAAARRRLRFAAPTHVSPWVLVPLCLAAVALWRFSPPSEYVMGGKDPGTYMNEGIQIAQRGSLVIHDEVVSSVPSFARDLFFPRHTQADGTPRVEYFGIRFMGFPILDVESGLVVGQFPHLFPASIAMGYGVAGLTGARWTTPVWAALGVLAVYFAGVRLFGRAVAGITALLLALNVIEVWFGRYPNAEVAMQALLFAALLANARAHVDDDPFFAPVAGALLGLLLFLRFDTVLAIAGVVVGIALGALVGHRPRWTFGIVLAGFSAVIYAYALGPMRAYAHQYFDFVRFLPWWQMVTLLTLTGGILLLVSFGSRNPRVSARAQQIIPAVLGAVVCIAAAYALFLRQPGGRLAVHDAYALRTFAHFYVTVPIVVAALLGFALYGRSTFWRDPALFVTVAVFSLFLFYKIRIVPEHFWAARRFVPVILPGVLLFAVAAAIGPGRRGRAQLVRLVLGAAFLFLACNNYVRASARVAAHVEYAGLIPKLEQLSSRFNEDDLVIVEGRDAQSDVHVMGLPLAYIYARQVLELKPARPDKPTFAAFLEWARQRYRRVFFVGGGGTDLLSFRYGVRAVASERFQVPEYESALNAFPRNVRRKEFEYGVYEFTAAENAASTTAPLWFDLDVGTNDDLHLLRFYAKEQTEGRTFRWTRGRSYVAVTTIAATAREVTLVLGDGGRPPAAAPARVDVFLHNQALGSITVTGGFRPYSLQIPPGLAERAVAAKDPVELRLISTTWNPLQVLGTPDDRELGVMVDRVTIK